MLFGCLSPADDRFFHPVGVDDAHELLFVGCCPGRRWEDPQLTVSKHAFDGSLPNIENLKPEVGLGADGGGPGSLYLKWQCVPSLGSPKQKLTPSFDQTFPCKDPRSKPGLFLSARASWAESERAAGLAASGAFMDSPTANAMAGSIMVTSLCGLGSFEPD